MEVTPSQSRVLKFGVFEVDLEARELRKSGMLSKLAPQHFQVLQLLLERAQQIVTREELQRRIWPRDTFVDYDLALKKAVNRLREVLGDSAESPRFIETIPRRGYRFIATVEGVSGSPGAKETRRGEEVFRRWRWLGWTAAIACSAALASALFAWNAFGVRDRVLGGASVPRIQSLAVLPLANLSGDSAQEYFSDGMTDALITDLAQMGSVKVISRTSIMGYKKTNKRLPEIARELKVDGIIEGTVQRSGDHVRITAQLIHGPSDKHLWAASYERDLCDVFALERDVTHEVARQIRAQVTTQKPAPSAQRPVNPRALDAYLQGNYYLNGFGKGSGDEGKKEAQKYFQQAVDADPNFAPGYVGMSSAYYGLLWPSREDIAIRKRMLEKALALDPVSSDAWTGLGDFKFEVSWDWPGAEEAYRRATALNPNHAWAHAMLGQFLAAMGRLDEGFKEYQIAQELDPNYDFLSDALYLRGEYDRAIARVLMKLKRGPDDGYCHYSLFESYTGKRMYKEAVQELENFITLFGFPQTTASIHRGFATSGYRGAIEEWAKDLEHRYAVHQMFLPISTAEAYAAIGDKDRAFYWLDEAYKHRDTPPTEGGLEHLKSHPMLDPLRSDPRYTDLVRRVGLPP